METKPSLKIFLVDDDPFCLNIYRQHLLILGYSNITTFENDVDCVNCLADQPEVIFLSHDMNAENGIDVLKKIKRFNPDIYVVVVSGQEDIIATVNSLKYGAFDYIIKGEKEADSLKEVLQKIEEVKELLSNTRPNFMKKLFSSG